MDNMWKEQMDLPVENIHHMSAQLTGMANILRHNSNSTLMENAKKESKLQNFVETLGDQGPNEFLYLVKSRESRSFISKIRTGVTDFNLCWSTRFVCRNWTQEKCSKRIKDLYSV